jgi:Raf kinase inhibitor-like YbhB/YbcL family protein
VTEFSLSSAAFAARGSIPRRHTCEGEDLSPPLSWTSPPEGCRSLALILDDPDAPAGRFIHWLAWGIPPGFGGLRESERAPLEGRNDFGTVGYRGPCPPRGGGSHRYRFRLYALTEEPSLVAGAEVGQLEQLISSSTLSAAELVGTYER